MEPWIWGKDRARRSARMLVLCSSLACLSWAMGCGLLPWSSVGERDAKEMHGAQSGDKQLLFGDLHIHTTYSWDSFLFSLPISGGEGAHPPDDACDFARYCADLDFYALTDHAESLSIENWEASKASVRRCNERAGDPRSPDLVAFAGFEWSQAGATPEEHWGHRCVVFSENRRRGPSRPADRLPRRVRHAVGPGQRDARRGGRAPLRTTSTGSPSGPPVPTGSTAARYRRPASRRPKRPQR